MTDLAASTLHSRLHEEGVLAELRTAWSSSGGSIRIEEVLAPGLADALAQVALTRLPFMASHLTTGSHTPCFFWRCVLDVGGQARGEARLEPPLDAAADFVLRDLPRLATAITGRSLACPEPVMGFNRFRKGCYLDPHNDEWDGPATAWVLGLTRAAWPVEEGGHLTFLDEDRTTVRSSRPPGWDTLDLYDSHPLPRWHAVPLLLTHRDRVTMGGLMAGVSP